MPNLSDSCRVDRLPASVRQLAGEVGMGFPLSLRRFIRDARCAHGQCVTLHLKTLATPTRQIRDQLISMRTVYNGAAVGVDVGSRQELTGTAFTTLVDVDVAKCDGVMTAEQTTLFGNRAGAGANDVVVYFVRSTNPALNGCASHPAGQPGAVVTDLASRWTLAHETGHVLGLSHISGENAAAGGRPCSTPDRTRLMTGCGTGAITGTPTISSAEATTMRDSTLTHDCPR
ncbi:hypothetical protein ACTMTI_24485 [Nonomuraea sp. H19]|uniref:hypothetical protein n=1 Tax=Nonomuraea sp. H19 TaxID=3452206 RepID=UPI003F8A9705